MNFMDTFPETLRWSTYFALDAAKGGEVQKRYEEDLRAFRHGTSIKKTEGRIRDLLRHACATTAFYRDMDPEADLSSFPIVDKNIFRDRYDDFISSTYKNKKGCRTMSTSGSTGTPLTIIQDPHKIKMNTADAIFLGTLARYYIGEKVAFIRVWVSNVKRSRISLLAENMIMMDSSSLSDDAIADMLDTICKKHVKCLVGYSSALGEISRFITRNAVDMDKFEVHSIIPISESMPETVRSALQHQFNCTVQSWYSNEENGIMGVQDPIRSSYYINSEGYYYEILKMDCDEPCEDGELGRLVITDLNNYAFPIIRYDNGDTAIAHRVEKNGRFRMSLKELYGRRSDMLFDTKGQPVTPYIVTNNLWDAKGVGQYQFIQKGIRQYELRLTGDRSLMDVQDMLDRIRPSLGMDADIEVTFVDEIPVLRSGKRKYIVNDAPEYQDRL